MASQRHGFYLWLRKWGSFRQLHVVYGCCWLMLLCSFYWCMTVIASKWSYSSWKGTTCFWIVWNDSVSFPYLFHWCNIAHHRVDWCMACMMSYLGRSPGDSLRLWRCIVAWVSLLSSNCEFYKYIELIPELGSYFSLLVLEFLVTDFWFFF